MDIATAIAIRVCLLKVLPTGIKSFFKTGERSFLINNRNVLGKFKYNTLNDMQLSTDYYNMIHSKTSEYEVN